MKTYQKITIITLILIVALIIAINFGGIYKLKEYKVINVVPKYSLGMEFKGSRILNLEIDDTVNGNTVYDSQGNVVEQQNGIDYTAENGYNVIQNKVNPDDKLTDANYKLAKQILINRLNKLGAEQYIIRKDNSGNISVEIPENNSTSYILSYLSQTGKFEMVDKESSEVLMDNSDIQNATVVYASETTGTKVYMQIQFNKEGTKKLEEISKIYIATTETAEDGTTSETTKNVSMNFDGETYMSTYFGETMTNGVLNIPIGTASDSTKMQEYIEKANGLAIVLNTGIIPLVYNASSENVSKVITQDLLNIPMYVSIGILAVGFIYLIIKFKFRGLLSSILSAGFIAALLIVLKYTKVIITLEGMIGIIVSVIINYLFVYMLLSNVYKESIKKLLIKFTIPLIPIFAISVIFTFATALNLSSLGMVMFWGLSIMYIYNMIFTYPILNSMKKDKVERTDKKDAKK